MPQTGLARRDYSLTGQEAARAEELGLVSAGWYHSKVPSKVMKELMQRRDGPAPRDTLLVGSGAGGVLTWWTWYTVPFFLVYGVLYGSACDSRWHECGHGTAFRTQWRNRWGYNLASFMVLRNPVAWRWSHMRHHTDTIIVGRDPEISVMRPPDMARKALSFIGIPDVFQHFAILVRQAILGPEFQ